MLCQVSIPPILLRSSVGRPSLVISAWPPGFRSIFEGRYHENPQVCGTVPRTHLGRLGGGNLAFDYQAVSANLLVKGVGLSIPEHHQCAKICTWAEWCQHTDQTGEAWDGTGAPSTSSSTGCSVDSHTTPPKQNRTKKHVRLHAFKYKHQKSTHRGWNAWASNQLQNVASTAYQNTAYQNTSNGIIITTYYGWKKMKPPSGWHIWYYWCQIWLERVGL